MSSLSVVDVPPLVRSMVPALTTVTSCPAVNGRIERCCWPENSVLLEFDGQDARAGAGIAQDEVTVQRQLGVLHQLDQLPIDQPVRTIGRRIDQGQPVVSLPAIDGDGAQVRRGQVLQGGIVVARPHVDAAHQAAGPQQGVVTGAGAHEPRDFPAGYGHCIASGALQHVAVHAAALHQERVVAVPHVAVAVDRAVVGDQVVAGAQRNRGALDGAEVADRGLARSGDEDALVDRGAEPRC